MNTDRLEYDLDHFKTLSEKLAEELGQARSLLALIITSADVIRDGHNAIEVDMGKVLDCQGDKCRRPECIACNGNGALRLPHVLTELGRQVMAYDSYSDQAKAILAMEP